MSDIERLSVQERTTLALLGALALILLGVLGWQRRPVALSVSVPPAEAAAVTPAQAAQWDGAVDAARQVDVNAADAAALERLPGVGPSLAKRIVEERQRRGPFQSPEALTRVRGIGPKTVEAVKDYVKVGSD